MNQAILKIEDVKKTYNGIDWVLKGVSLNVPKSEVIALIGPSGCGKSTLLRSINGLETIQGGQIVLDDEIITDGAIPWYQVRERVGMVFQSYELFPHLSILRNLTLAPTKVKREPKAQSEARALALLERFGLADRADAYPRELSGGQKQRVAIIRALMMEPEILLLDEVTASLDPEMVGEVLEVVRSLAEDGMTMLIVTHEMQFARSVADRVAFMNHGVIEELATAAEFFAKPRSERAQRFVDGLPTYVI